MKKFDIELARQGHPVCTRLGLSVKILDFDFKKDPYCIIAKRENEDNRESLMLFTKEGKRYNLGAPDSYDLFMASEKKEGWINIYPKRPKGSKKRETGTCIYPTEKDAKTASCNNCVATIKIEWEE